MRDLHYNPNAKLRKTCMRFGISTSLFYQLAEDYRSYGPWAILPALSFGSNKKISEETQLEIILKKLRYPTFSGEQIASELKLKGGRHVVNRVVSHWGIEDKSMKPCDLQQYLGGAGNTNIQGEDEFIPPRAAIHIIKEEEPSDLTWYGT